MQATQSLGEDLVEDDCKRLSFYFSVYIEGSPPAEEPSGLMPRGKILKCSHIPIKKTVVTGGQVPVLSTDSPEVWEHPRALTRSDGTTSGEPTRTRT